jgi:hypothetical protein
MIVAIDDDEQRALDVVKRGMDGLMRRTFGSHRFDKLVISEEEQQAALVPLRHIQEHLEAAIHLGAGTPAQIAERFAGMLEPGLIDMVVLQIPTGDMTIDETRRTLDLFVTEVKPQLDAQAV